MRRSKPGLVAGALATLALVAGCTTVPTDSTPKIVKPVQAAGPSAAPDPVANNASPRNVVTYFLAGNANVSDVQNTAAYSVLTKHANWVNSGVTILNSVQVGNATGKPGSTTTTVTVSGVESGTLDAAGRYSPAPSKATVSYDFRLALVATGKKGPKQWRITDARKGVLLSVQQFEQYHQQVLYYFDSTYPSPTTQFVPQPRYSALTDPAALANWMVKGLTGDPGDPALQQGLQVADPSSVEVVFPTEQSPDGAPVRIDVPGASNLGADARNALAAELGATLGQIRAITALEITDNGTPVRISAVGGTTFSPSASSLLGRYEPPTNADPELYYVQAGSVHRESGARLQIPVLPTSATGGYSLTSVALHPETSGTQFEVAATYGVGNVGRFAIGTQGRLKPVAAVQGRLTRPSWEPGGEYAWIGAGKALYRVSVSGVAVKVNLNLVGSPGIVAVRVSPDGGRLALVVSSADGTTSSVDVATIQSNGKNLSVALSGAITPDSVLVSDVAWYDNLQLFVTGRDLNSADSIVFDSVQCDGSGVTSRQIANLPGVPDSLTIANGVNAVVSVGGTLLRLSDVGDQWQAVHSDTFGLNNPVYTE